MLGQPEPVEAQLFRMPRQVEAILQRLPRGGAFHDGRKIED